MSPEDRFQIWQKQMEWYAREKREADERRKQHHERSELQKRVDPQITIEDIKRAVEEARKKS